MTPRKRLELRHISLFGNGGVGKQCLTVRYAAGYFLECYDPHGDHSYCKQVLIDDKPCAVEAFYSRSSLEEYSAMYTVIVKQTEGFLLVYSITDRKSFEDVRAHRDRILEARRELREKKGEQERFTDKKSSEGVMDHMETRETREKREEKEQDKQDARKKEEEEEEEDKNLKDDDILMVLVGNKSDKNDDRVVSKEDGENLARELGCHFVETSAKENTHVDQPFAHIVREVRREEERQKALTKRNEEEAEGEKVEKEKKSVGCWRGKGCVVM